MPSSVIYTPVEECPEIVIVPERDLVYSYQRGRFDTALLFRRRISGKFNELAEHLYDRHSCKDVMTVDGRRLETFYNLQGLDALRGKTPYEGELGLIIADMREARQKTLRSPELRVVPANGYNRLNYEFHQDGGDRIMCCYNDPTTECIRQEHGTKQITDRFIHFAKGADEPVFHFNNGDVWFQAGGAQGLKHRAVQTSTADPVRMLMVC
jgi:hypothetical protein